MSAESCRSCWRRHLPEYRNTCGARYYHHSVVGQLLMHWSLSYWDWAWSRSSCLASSGTLCVTQVCNQRAISFSVAKPPTRIQYEWPFSGSLKHVIYQGFVFNLWWPSISHSNIAQTTQLFAPFDVFLSFYLLVDLLYLELMHGKPLFGLEKFSTRFSLSSNHTRPLLPQPLSHPTNTIFAYRGRHMLTRLITHCYLECMYLCCFVSLWHLLADATNESLLQFFLFLFL